MNETFIPGLERVCLKKGYCGNFRDLNHPEQGFPYDIYIGRKHSYPNNPYRFQESQYCNHFTVKKYGDEEAVLLFMENTLPHLDIDSLVDIYKKHGRLRLGCWCFPDENCHGNVLLEVVGIALSNEVKRCSATD